MQFSLGREDRKLLMAAALVIVAASAVAAWLAPPRATRRGGASSYSSASDGALGAYLLLARMGCSVERWTRPPQDLPAIGAGSVLILADPTLHPTVEEQSAIQSFAATGGRVLVTGYLGTRMLGLKEPVLSPEFEASRSETFEAQIPGPLTRSASRIEMHAPERLPNTPGWQLPSYGDPQGAVVISYKLGRGEAISWGSVMPLTNTGLGKAGNLALFLNSTDASERPRIFWDEYFHGVRRGLWSYAAATSLPWGLAQIGLIFIVAIITFSRRSGPVRPLAAESRLAPLEFVDTLGALYHRKRAARTALEIEYHRFRLHLERRFRCLAAAGVEATHGFRGSAATDPVLTKTVEECETLLNARHVSEPAALRMIQALEDQSRRLSLDYSGTGAIR